MPPVRKLLRSYWLNAGWFRIATNMVGTPPKLVQCSAWMVSRVASGSNASPR